MLGCTDTPERPGRPRSPWRRQLRKQAWTRPYELRASALLRVLLEPIRLRSAGNLLVKMRGIDAAAHLTTFTAASNQLQDTAGAGALVRLLKLDLSCNGLETCEEVLLRGHDSPNTPAGRVRSPRICRRSPL